MRRSGTDPTQQIESRKNAAPPHLFNRNPRQKQKEHVTDQVHPAAGQRHERDVMEARGLVIARHEAVLEELIASIGFDEFGGETIHLRLFVEDAAVTRSSLAL